MGDLITIVIILFTVFVLMTFKIIPNHQKAVLERLGQYKKTLYPGFHFIIPFVDRIAYKHDMREQVLDIPAQQCITKDNVQVYVDGIVYLKVEDAQKASYGIGNYITAAIGLAQTTMRSEIGKLELDDTFSERERINENIVREIDKAADPWGIKFIRYEIKNIDPSPEQLDTMEKQMEAERQRRADITMADGEKESMNIQSEGKRQEAINISEGKKQKLENEAKGKAREIEMVSNATAEGMKRIAAALNQPGGNLALQLRILEKYIKDLGEILATTKVSIVPADLANMKAFFEGVNQVGSSIPSMNPSTGDQK